VDVRAPPAVLASLLPPFVAAPPALWRERYAPSCAACFAASRVCGHHAEVPLRLLLIGHNPSTHAWASGYPYSNPSNRFWKLMAAAALVPPGFVARDADAAPAALGLGITDVGCVPGSDASAFGRAAMRVWRAELYARLRAHLQRAAAWAGDDCSSHDDARLAACYAPRVVAFTGKRQWKELFEPPLANVAAGRQPDALRPPSWPLPPGRCEVWVLPSSSGRAVMTHEEREGPYRELGARVAALTWPLMADAPREDADGGAGVLR
jgi:TDG/mug DNA glycosylase family protein